MLTPTGCLTSTGGVIEDRPSPVPPWAQSQVFSLLDLLEFMKEIGAAALFSMVDAIEKLANEGSADEAIDGDDLLTVELRAAALAMACSNYEAGVSAKALEELSGHVEFCRRHSRPLTYREVRNEAAEIRRWLVRELGLALFFRIPGNRTEDFREHRKGWESIIERFPEVDSDLEEARKCFALGRYTATVFHSLLLVEAGVIDLGRFIGVNDPKPGWGPTSNELERITKLPHGQRPPFAQRNREFLDQVQGTIRALKDSWRNKVSHVHGRLVVMTTDFPEKVAEEVLIATRGFMGRLVDGLPSREDAD